MFFRFLAVLALTTSMALSLSAGVFTPSDLLHFELTSTDILNDCQQAKKRAESELQHIITLPPSIRTFENTLWRFDLAVSDFIDQTNTDIFAQHVSTSAEVREASHQCEILVSQFKNEILTRSDLNRAIKEYQLKKTPLAKEESRLLDKILLDFRRAGLELPLEKRNQARELSSRISRLQSDFSRNLNESTPSTLLSEEQLAGVPAHIRGSLEKMGGQYKINLDFPTYQVFITQASSAAVRQRLQVTFANRAERLNVPILKEALFLRQAAARLRGYHSHAEFVTEVTMARHPKAIKDFLSRLRKKLIPLGQSELGVLVALKNTTDGPGSDGIIHLWDWRYFDNILRKKTYAVDDEEVRDYFPTNVVVERMLQLYQTILGLSFREIENPLTWHPSVKLYEVTNTGSTEPIGYFYLDLFPREGKYPQAETAALVTGRRRLDGSYQKPVSALIANVRNATNTRPSLLSHKEIVVLFHEFGHIMHHTLCKNKYGRLTAFNVSSDFIETPSQMMENWTWDRDILEFLSGHYKDQSQKIPRDMSEKIVAARYTGVGLNTLMQLSLALIDLTYHGPSVPRDPSKAFAKTFSDTALIPLSPGTHPEGQFGHIMDGYDAGYYGYLWSSVYAQDMFSIFKKYGLRDITIGRRYREEILEPGATRDDMQSLKSFLGREPDQKSFYESIGLAL